MISRVACSSGISIVFATLIAASDWERMFSSCVACSLICRLIAAHRSAGDCAGFVGLRWASGVLFSALDGAEDAFLGPAIGPASAEVSFSLFLPAFPGRLLPLAQTSAGYPNSLACPSQT